MNFIQDMHQFSDPSFFITKAIKKSYEILKKMISGNKSHQRYFFKILKFFCMDLKNDFDQVEVIIEIYKNNYKLCCTIDEDFIGIFKDCILKYGRQARFLKIFEHVQIVKKEPIIDVQIKVLNFLINSDRYHYFCYSKGYDLIEFTYEKEAIGDQPIDYHAALISVLSYASKGVSGIELNESKCTRILPIEDLFVLLKKCDTVEAFKPMALPLINFFYEVYIDSKFGSQKMLYTNLFVKVVSRTAENIAEFEKKRIKVIIKILKSYFESYKIDNDEFAVLNNETQKFFEELNKNRKIFEFPIFDEN